MENLKQKHGIEIITINETKTDRILYTIKHLKPLCIISIYYEKFYNVDLVLMPVARNFQRGFDQLGKPSSRSRVWGFGAKS